MKIIAIHSNTQNQINFKNTGLNKQAMQELETVAKPFLAQYQRPKDISLLEEISKKLQKLNVCQNIIPEYNPNEFKEVKRLHLGDLGSNLDEFDYLAKKSKKWYAGRDASIMARTIVKSGLFEVPDFMAAPFNFYKQLKVDIKNGLTNITIDKLAPHQYEKWEKLKIAERELIYNNMRYEEVYCQSNYLKDLVDNNTLTEDSFAKIRAIIKNAVDFHTNKKLELEKNTEMANDINQNISVSDEDENLLNNIHKPAQRVISRNVSKFNKKVQNTSLNIEQQNFIEELLNNQKVAIENLWHSIEKGKRLTFEGKIKPLFMDSTSFWELIGP